MPIIPNSAQVRTRHIREDLEAVRENLLALSDDIWLSIDHNDPEALANHLGLRSMIMPVLLVVGLLVVLLVARQFKLNVRALGALLIETPEGLAPFHRTLIDWLKQFCASKN